MEENITTTSTADVLKLYAEILGGAILSAIGNFLMFGVVNYVDPFLGIDWTLDNSSNLNFALFSFSVGATACYFALSLFVSSVAGADLPWFSHLISGLTGSLTAVSLMVVSGVYANVFVCLSPHLGFLLCLLRSISSIRRSFANHSSFEGLR